jgi:hypothetical protein
MVSLLKTANMELHKVPRGSKIKVKSDIKVPPGAPEIQEEQILIFNHIDGMYSHCLDLNGNVVHLDAWAEVELVND